MKTTRLAPPAAPKGRIVRFDPPAAPKVDPMSPGAPKQADQLTSGGKPPQGGSNAVAAHAVWVASHPGEIDPTQQHY
jgi:hypothetical protein